MQSFTDFLNKRRQTGAAQTADVTAAQQPQQSVEAINAPSTRQFTEEELPRLKTACFPTQPQTPKVDSDNPIGSLSDILGPSPAERAAEEERQQKHRQKMHGWTAFFNGLRHLSNLYYTTKGAAPQKYSDPHVQIEQQYQDERKRLADIQAANQKYYTNMWELYRQENDEKRRQDMHDIQIEQNERQRKQSEQNDRMSDAQIDSINARTEYTREQTNQLREMSPLKKQKIEAEIQKTLASIKNGGKSGGGSKEDPFKDLGKLIERYGTDAVGPFIQANGLGYYNSETGELNLNKTLNAGTTKVTNIQIRNGMKGNTSGNSGGKKSPTAAGGKKSPTA